MKYKKLGKTELEVSLICLGTMTWGRQNTETDAHTQMNYAIGQGVNFFDTAEMYPIPPNERTQGLTETYIGNWFTKNKNRSKIMLATKVTGPGAFVKYIRNGPRFTKEHIQSAVDESLRRLRTDYIDLYQLHWPERKTNFFGQLGYTPLQDNDSIPIEETLEILDGIVDTGKIRYLGISNETPWGTMEYLRLSEQTDLPRIQSIQNPYNLLNRTFELGLSEISYREKVGLLAYSPLAFGTLSGKYLTNEKPKRARLSLFGRHYGRYSSPQAVRATKEYVEIANRHGIDPAQMALAFINEQIFVTSNIIGATTMKQLKSNISSVELSLTTEIQKEIHAVHEQNSNPSP